MAHIQESGYGGGVLGMRFRHGLSDCCGVGRPHGAKDKGGVGVSAQVGGKEHAQETRVEALADGLGRKRQEAQDIENRQAR